MPRVFISYSHDSPEHSERVLNFAWALRSHGIDVELDQFHNEQIVDWPRWCREQISREHSEFVVCVCTAEYRRRIDGHVPPEKGKGVHWEGSLLDDDIYDEKTNRRIIPVFLDGEPETSIVGFLRGWTHCRVRTFQINDPGYEHLLRILTGKASVEKNSLGVIPDLPTKRAPVRSSLQPTDIQADISRIIKYAPAELIGRDEETKLLTGAWDKAMRDETKRPHILTFVALGGEGKTSLVAKWVVDEMLGKGWPGCDAAFAWSFYSQGTRDQVAASSDLFLKEALVFFGDERDKEFAGSSAGAFEKGQRLARIVGQRRCLLILDGLEPLQHAPSSPTPGQLKDQGIAALLKGLAQNNGGLCVITTRYSVPDLKAFWQTTTPEVKLLRLSRDAGVHLLKTLSVHGSERRNIPRENRDPHSEKFNEFEKLVEDVKGHALTLTLLGSYLREAHGGDIRKRDLVKLEEADAEVVLIADHPNHVFHVMDAYVEWFETGGKDEEENKKGLRALTLLRLLGLFDRPATAECLNALWTGDAIANLTEPLVGLEETQRNISLTRLEAAKLLTVNRDATGALVSLDAHPHLREYFAKQLREKNPEAWRAAHRRLFEHLCKHKDGNRPSLEDLQPLYQAVAHGCQAGMHEEARTAVFRDRILQREEEYSTRKLGAFASNLGAVTCFFEAPWKKVLPALSESTHAWLLDHAGFALRALGRMTEAVEPMRAALKRDVADEHWKSAAGSANNLSELKLTLGDIAGAVTDAEQSVTYADRKSDMFQRLARRSTHADALHQAGCRTEAEALFREAEQIQKEYRSDYPLLYSLYGFRYCDLLLAAPERAAWQLTLDSSFIPDPSSVAACSAISARAAQTLKWEEVMPGAPLLDFALHHLALGRAALCQATLTKSEVGAAKSEVEQAVTDFRNAGHQDELPKGLLTRAWLRFLIGARTGPDSAQEDLDEAWEIAERGPMRLFMADIHLYRARLFFREKSYPWESPAADLAAAEKLINDCGYHRRDEELADAKRAILSSGSA